MKIIAGKPTHTRDECIRYIKRIFKHPRLRIQGFKITGRTAKGGTLTLSWGEVAKTKRR